jgi:hypothetical protein
MFKEGVNQRKPVLIAKDREYTKAMKWKDAETKHDILQSNMLNLKCSDFQNWKFNSNNFYLDETIKLENQSNISSDFV